MVTVAENYLEYFHRKANYIYDVIDYGAVGDGTTDDTVVVQAALTAGAGSYVLIPPGTYIISTVLTVPAGTTVRGAGRDLTTLKWADNAGAMSSDTGLLDVDASDVTIRGLTIDCNKDNQGGTVDLNGVHGNDSDNLVVEWCTIKNITADANGGMGNGVRTMTGTYTGLVIRNNIFHDILVSNPIQMSDVPSSFNISDNIVYDCGRGIDVSTGGNGIIHGNIVRDITPGFAAIQVFNAARVIVSNNHIRACRVGIAGGGQFGESTIVGNIIMGDYNAAAIGIHLDSASGGGASAISGNRVQNAGTGIKIDGGDDDAITGNVIQGCATGINIAGAVDRVLVSGNRINGAGTDAVNLGASTTNCFVHGNHIGGSSGGTTDSGTGNTLSDNMTT